MIWRMKAPSSSVCSARVCAGRWGHGASGAHVVLGWAILAFRWSPVFRKAPGPCSPGQPLPFQPAPVCRHPRRPLPGPRAAGALPGRVLAQFKDPSLCDHLILFLKSRSGTIGHPHQSLLEKRSPRSHLLSESGDRRPERPALGSAAVAFRELPRAAGSLVLTPALRGGRESESGSLMGWRSDQFTHQSPVLTDFHPCPWRSSEGDPDARSNLS